jgi:hypothetical protein
MCSDVRQELCEDPPCETCNNPVLRVENYEAWWLYTEFINTKFCVDYPGAIMLIFDILGLKKTREAAIAMLEKLILIHAVVSKKKEEVKPA